MRKDKLRTHITFATLIKSGEVLFQMQSFSLGDFRAQTWGWIYFFHSRLCLFSRRPGQVARFLIRSIGQFMLLSGLKSHTIKTPCLHIHKNIFELLHVHINLFSWYIVTKHLWTQLTFNQTWLPVSQLHCNHVGYHHVPLHLEENVAICCWS